MQMSAHQTQTTLVVFNNQCYMSLTLTSVGLVLETNYQHTTLCVIDFLICLLKRHFTVLTHKTEA